MLWPPHYPFFHHVQVVIDSASRTCGHTKRGLQLKPSPEEKKYNVLPLIESVYMRDAFNNNGGKDAPDENGAATPAFSIAA